MSNLKSLAGQTLWYGLSNIAARLLNVLLTPLLTYILNTPKGQADFGDFSIIYALISFANVVYTYGMETAYFRFSADKTIDRASLWRRLSARSFFLPSALARCSFSTARR